MRAPCGLVKSVLYMHVIMLMSVWLHDRPLWPSVVLPAIDQGRVSRARSGMLLWRIYQLLARARSVFPDSSFLCASVMWNMTVTRNFHTGSFRETRSGRSVNTQDTPLYLEAIRLRHRVQQVNLFTFIANYYATLTFLWQCIIIGHLYQDYSY